MNIKQVEKLSGSQINDLYRLFQMEWWTKGRERKDVEVMVRNSDIVVGMMDAGTEELIGFARVLTDFVYKAFIFDVIISKPFREQKLGRNLMNAIIHHPKLNTTGFMRLI
jgi:predicted GNAT family N-acyltransferase